MKRTVLLLIMTAVACGAMGQPALNKGYENNRPDAATIAEGIYAGQHGRYDCWVMEGKRHLKQMQMYDMNLVPQHTIDLPKSNDYRVLAASMDDTRAGVLVVDQSEKRRTVVGRYVVDLKNFAVEGERMDTLQRFDYERKDECLVWGATSPSGNYMALVAVVKYHQTQEYRTYIALYDGAMQQQWSQEFALGTMSEVAVTDDGRVVTLGLEPGEDEQCIVVNQLSANDGRNSKVFFKSGPLHELHIAAVHGNHLLALGTFAADGNRKVQHFGGGLVAMSYSLDSASLTSITKRGLNNEDINIFYNKPTKRMQHELMCDNYRLVASTPTSYGCAGVFGRMFRAEYSNANGSKVSDYAAVGMQCLAMDTLGHIMWVRNLRRADIQRESSELLGIGLVEANGRTTLVKSEHKKYPATYDISKAAKELEMGSKANIVMYTFDANGEVQKTLIEKAVKQNIVRVFKRRDGNLLLMTSTGDRSRAAELKFVY